MKYFSPIFWQNKSNKLYLQWNYNTYLSSHDVFRGKGKVPASKHHLIFK